MQRVLYNIYMKVSPYLSLMRVDKPIGVWLLLFPTLFALFIFAHGKLHSHEVIFFCMQVFLLRSLGCVINDICDCKVDALVERTKDRPLVVGEVTYKKALILATFLGIPIILSSILVLNLMAWIVVVFAGSTLFTYPLFKRFFFLPQLYLGLSFSSSILIVAAQYNVLFSLVTLVLFLANLFWVLAYDTIYSLSDKDYDVKLNLHSASIFFGQYSLVFIYGSYILFFILMLLLGHLLHLTLLYFFFLFISFAIICKCLFYTTRGKFMAGFLLNQWVGYTVLFGIMVNFLVTN